MSKRQQPEQDLQMTIANWFRIAMGPQVIWFHVPNGGWRKPVEGALFKSMGLRPGVADFCLIWRWEPDFKGTEIGNPVPLFGAAFIELKAPGKAPRLSEPQREFRDDCERLGVRYGVAQSLEDVEALLTEWRVPRRRDLEGKLLF